MMQYKNPCKSISLQLSCNKKFAHGAFKCFKEHFTISSLFFPYFLFLSLCFSLLFRQIKFLSRQKLAKQGNGILLSAGIANVRIHDALNKINIIEGVKLGSLKGTINLQKLWPKRRTSLNVTFRCDIQGISGEIKIRDVIFFVAKNRERKKKKTDMEGYKKRASRQRATRWIKL